MKTVNNFLTIAAIVWGIAVLIHQSESVYGALFFLPFSLGPLFADLVIAHFCERALSLVLLSTSAVVYCSWFFFVYLDAFYWNPDAQSAIALVFVGIWALPVMLVFWSLALWKRKPLSDLKS